MKTIIAVAALAALVSGCAQVEQARDSAARAKQAANDLQAETWQMLACDLTFGGAARELDRDLMEAAAKFCFKGNPPAAMVEE